jgi:hypothetical protein
MHRRLSMVALTAATPFIIFSGLSDTARAQAVDAQLQCWNEATETPISPLVITTPGQQLGCLLRISNNTGASITGAQLRLSFSEAPQIPYTSTALMPQDIGARIECATAPVGNGTFRPRIVTDVAASFPGFLSGTATGGILGRSRNRCADFVGPSPTATWTVELPAGQAVSARVEFRAAPLLAGASFSGAVRVDYLNRPAEVAFTAPVLPLSVTMPTTPPDILQIQVLPVFREVALAGQVYFGTTNQSGRPSHSGLVGELVLPYLRPDGNGGWVRRIDTAFDIAAGDVLLFDPDDLELGLALREHTVESGDQSWLWHDFSDGTSGARANAPSLVFERPAPNVIRIPYGFLGGIGNDSVSSRRYRVIWVAAFSQNPNVQAWLAAQAPNTSGYVDNFVTGAICVTSDQSERRCLDATTRLYSESAFGNTLPSPFTFEHNANLGRNEANAALPGSRYLLHIGPPLVPWRGASLALHWQNFGNSDGHAMRQTNAIAGVTPTVYPDSEIDFFGYATAMADQGSELDLWARNVPVAAEDAWTPHPFATSNGVGNGSNLTPDTATEFRILCSPSRYGVRVAGERGCGVNVNHTVPFNARSSINENPDTWVERDMRLASLGSLARATYTVPGRESPINIFKSYHIEVDGRSRMTVQHTRSNASGASADPLRNVGVVTSVPDVATGVNAPNGCVFGNQSVGNVIGPVTVTMSYPVGWRPLTTDPLASVRPIYSIETLPPGNNWGARTFVAVPADRIVSTVHDPVARTFAVTLRGPGEEQRFLGTDELAEVTNPTGYAFVRTLGLVVEGTYVPGTARNPPFGCTANVTSAVRTDQTVGSVRLEATPVPRHRVLGDASPSIRGASDRPRVLGFDRWNVRLELRNSAYNADGTLRSNGAAVSAREAVAMLRVPREGDFNEAIESGQVAVRFDSAVTPDGYGTWVSAIDSPVRHVAFESGFADNPDWDFCASAGQPCDAVALLDAGLAPADVRWVAFARDELLVTDAEPRGQAPLGGLTRIENPWFADVQLVDTGSTAGTRIRPVAEFVSLDSLVLTATVGSMDVIVDAFCDARVVGTACGAGVGECTRQGLWYCDLSESAIACDALPGEPVAERCDERDWNCNGQPLDGFVGLGESCTAGQGACLRDGVRSCAADGGGVVCNAVAGQPTSELCDGVDNDCNGATDDMPGTGEPCTVGVGECARPGVTVCDREAGSTLLCAGEAGEPVAERCDARDWDCNGEPYNGFDAVGTACAAGEGACRNVGLLICDQAAQALVCTAVAGEPNQTEVCDGFDNDCSGTIDDVTGLGDACVAGLGECATDGVLACRAGAGPAPVCVADVPAGTPELCDDRDWDCDGSANNGFPVGQACIVATGLGDCELPGVWTCNDGRDGVVCDIGAAVCPEKPCEVASGQPCEVGIGGCRRAGVTACADDGTDAVVCTAEPGAGTAETCNGVDDDCDAIIDNAAEDCSCDGLAGAADNCPGAWTPVPVDNNSNGIGDACECGATCRVFIDGCLVDGRTACEAGETSGICRPNAEALDGEGRVREAFCTPAECGAPVPVCEGPDADGDGVPEGEGVGCDVCPGVFDPGQASGDDAVCSCSNEGRSCSVLLRPNCWVAGQLACAEGASRAACEYDAEAVECLPAGCVLDGCDPVVERPCEALEGEACTVGVGVCAASGQTLCAADGVGVTCDATAGAPGVESCNDLDDDCDGDTDEGACPTEDGLIAEGGGGCGGGAAGGLWWLVALAFAARRVSDRRGSKPVA